jgi:hypothetical protein
MMPAATTAGGTFMAMPDTCNTPAAGGAPTPTPFPNMAQGAAALNTSTNVLIENMPIVVEGAKIPSSNGDESGVMGGVVSGLIMGEVAPKVFSSTVYAGGKKIAYLTGVSGHNGVNANAPAGAMIVPSQVRVTVGF